MDKRYEIINDKLNSLSKSTFRSSFYLKDKDKNYIIDKGMNTIRDHAYDIILKRLAPIDIKNDGKQTPMRGHPVFIAQHATGCCCRGCLFKWHGIPKNRELSNNEINYIVMLIVEWIKRQME